MTKLVQNDIASLTNEQSALAALNSNYASLEVWSDSVLSRDGTSPNQMNADLDMNSNRILNLPEPANGSEPLRLQDVGTLNGGGLVGTVQANYITTSANSSLNNERVLAVGTGLSLTDGGAGGNLTINPANDLGAVEGLATNGLATRTAANTWTTRTLTGTANEITSTNGDGVAGNPTLSLPTSLTFTGKTVTGGTFSGPAITGTADIQQNMQWSGDISPTSFATQQDNYNPTNLATATVLRLTATANSDVTGLSGGADGRVIIVHNIGSFNITFKDESASSTAGNRFALSGDTVLAQDTSVVFQYDSTSSRWRLLGGTGNSSTSAPVFNVKTTYGAKADYTAIGDAAMSSGSAVLTSAASLFTANDVGKYIAVQGAAAAGANLFTTILSFQNAGQVTLNATNASGGAISGKFADWGTDDTTAIQNAINAATAAGGGVVYMPVGSYLITQLNLANKGSIILQGEGINATRLFAKNVAAYATTAGHLLDCTGSAFLQLKRFQIGAFYSMPQPQTAIFFGQVASNVSNRVLMDNLYVSGQYAIATLYIYGVPSSIASNSDFYNYKAGAGQQPCLVMTKDNRSSLTSSFATVTSGALSTSDWFFEGCEFHKFSGAGANNEVLMLDQVDNILFSSGVVSGGATQYVTFDAGTNTNITFDNVSFETESEPVTPTNAYSLAASSTLNGFFAPNSSYILSGNKFAGSGAFQSTKNGPTYMSNSGSALVANTTYFVGVGVSDTVSSNNSASLLTEDCVLCNLRAQTSASPGGVQTYTITLQVGGADTALTTTITGAGTTGTDTTHFVNASKGQTINFKVVTSATANTTRFMGSVSLLPV